MNTALATADGSRDFDFLIGSWRMHHRRLRERLRGAQQWDEYDGTGETIALPEGLGNREEVRFDYGGPVVGLSFRFYDHATGRWSIYWIDSRRRVLDRPVVGSFVGDTGIFLGEDTLEGTPILMRFVWSRVRIGKPRWEQAFSTDGGRNWETNWVIDLEPATAPAEAAR